MKIEDYNKVMMERERGWSKDAATGCTRDSLPMGVVCTDENQRVQSKGMLWPWDTRLRLQFHLCLIVCCRFILQSAFSWCGRLLYKPCLWIFNDTFWARAKKMIVSACGMLGCWHHVFLSLFCLFISLLHFQIPNQTSVQHYFQCIRTSSDDFDGLSAASKL